MKKGRAKKPKFSVEQLPSDQFYEGISCLLYPNDRRTFSLGEHRIRVWYSGASYKVHLLRDGRSVQRTLGVKIKQSAIEGAVCFLRAMARGEINRLLNPS